MLTLKHLRIAIAIFFLIYIASQATIIFYDPMLSSPVLLQRNELLKSSNFESFYLLAILPLAYACAALWFGYLSGKWVFLLYLLWELIAQYFNGVVAYSGLGSALESLYFLVLGIILTLLFTQPLRDELNTPKPYRLFSVILMFLVFLMLAVVPGFLFSFINLYFLSS